MFGHSSYILYKQPEDVFSSEQLDFFKKADSFYFHTADMSLKEFYEHDYQVMKTEGFYDLLDLTQEEKNIYFNTDWQKERQAKNRNQLTLFPQLETTLGYWTTAEESTPLTDTDRLIIGGLPAYIGLINMPESLDTFREKGLRLTLDQLLYFGAKVFEEKDYQREKDSWTITKNGKELTRFIGGDIHGDLRVWSKDTTAYSILNPLGRESLFRPHDKKSSEGLYAYHSTEPQLLQIATLYLKELKGEAYVQETLPRLQTKAKNTQFAMGAYTPFGHSSSDKHVFMRDSVSLKDKTRKYNFHTLGRQGDTPYHAHIDKKNNLVFTSRDNPIMTFYPEEAERLIEATLRQIYGGGGRTVPQTADVLVEYRLSEKYQQHLKGIF